LKKNGIPNGRLTNDPNLGKPDLGDFMPTTTKKLKMILKKLRGFILSMASAIMNHRPGSLIFQCNICGKTCIMPMGKLGRETISCMNCGSTVRMRAVIHALSTVLFSESLTLQNFPVQAHVRVYGLSDWDGYAIPLAHKLAYTNTFYHQEPRLDITFAAPTLAGTLDILISSDVFEHVAPPISIAFENSFRLLKPGGTLILTVPYNFESETKEHFPDLFQYEIRKDGGKPVLHNITRDDREQSFENLNFHGGAGETLEMRRFSWEGLKGELINAGFKRIEVLSEPNFKHGVYFEHPWSLPIIARKV